MFVITGLFVILESSWYNILCTLLKKETFITNVTLSFEKKEEVQMKCWAGWASEEKMRDELKIREWDTYTTLDCQWPNNDIKS